MTFISKTSIESDWTSVQRLNRKKWSVPITYYSNQDASYKLLISRDIELNLGPNSGNRVEGQGDANVRAPKCNTKL